LGGTGQIMGRQWWWERGVLAVVVLLAAAGCSAVGGGVSPGATGGSSSASSGAGSRATALPGVPGTEQARTELAGLTVAPHASMRGYSRAKFPHWAEQGDNCNTRELVLQRDGTDVKRDDKCLAVSGRWISVYDGKTFTDASDLDVDHTVPLANAWRSGASTWTQAKRKKFANDMTHPQLLSVSTVSNRSKGDQSPDQWQPPSKTYWCTYARSWVAVKSAYELSVTEAEKNKLGQMLDTCAP
jgi:Protein of unknown function (DUF1524)